MVHALEVQAPMWEPGTAFGYHALTMGFLVGEVVLRTSGRTIGTYFAEEVAAPLGLSCWIGLPHDEMNRVMPIRVNDRSNTAFVSDEVILAEKRPEVASTAKHLLTRFYKYLNGTIPLF